MSMFPNKFTFINDIDQLIEQVKDIIDTWDEISSSFKIKLVRMKDNASQTASRKARINNTQAVEIFLNTFKSTTN